MHELINWVKTKLKGLDEYEIDKSFTKAKASKLREKLVFRIFNLKQEHDFNPIEEAIMGKNTVILVNMSEIERCDKSRSLKWAHKLKNLCHDVKGSIGRLQGSIVVITPSSVSLGNVSGKI